MTDKEIAEVFNRVRQAYAEVEIRQLEQVLWSPSVRQLADEPILVDASVLEKDARGGAED